MTGLAALVLALALAPAAGAAERAKSNKADRVIQGQVYFTNNSPDVYDYPIELRTGDGRRRVLRTKTTADGGFRIRGLKPAVYIFHIDGPAGCLLRYRVDTRRRKEFRMTVVMDAACSGGNYIRDAINGIN